MERSDVMATVDKYAADREAEKHSGRLMVFIDMNQGGFQPPQFFQVQKQKAPVVSVPKFTMVE